MRQEFKIFFHQIRNWFVYNYKEIIILVVLALLTKFIFLGTHLGFSQDQVRDFLFIKNHVENGNFYIPLGPAAASYSDFNVPPFYYYLQYMAQWVSGNYFYSMDILIILIESLTPLLLYYLLQQISKKNKKGWLFNLPFLLSIGYLLSSTVLLYSTSAWNPNLMAFFSLLFIVASFVYIYKKKSMGLLIAILAYAIMLNLHFQCFVLMPLLLVILAVAIKRFKKSWLYLLLGLISSLIIFAPYLHFEMKNGFTNTEKTISFALGGEGEEQYDRLRKPKFWTFFFPGYYTRMLTGKNFITDWSRIYEDPEISKEMWGSAIIFWIIFALAFFNVFKWWRSDDKQLQQKAKWLSGLMVFFVTMILLLRLYKGDKPDYFLLTFNSFIWIFLLAVFNLIKNKWVPVVVIILIWIGEIWSWQGFPRMDAQADFADIAREIDKYPAHDRAIVFLNQELVVPFSFYYGEEEILAKPDPTKKYNLLICMFAQGCKYYQPNVCSPHTIYKYDLVTAEDFSAYFPNYEPTYSGSYSNNSLQLRIIAR